jgi:hypothetical protein
MSSRNLTDVEVCTNLARFAMSAPKSLGVWPRKAVQLVACAEGMTQTQLVRCLNITTPPRMVHIEWCISHGTGAFCQKLSFKLFITLLWIIYIPTRPSQSHRLYIVSRLVNHSDIACTATCSKLAFTKTFPQRSTWNQSLAWNIVKQLAARHLWHWDPRLPSDPWTLVGPTASDDFLAQELTQLQRHVSSENSTSSSTVFPCPVWGQFEGAASRPAGSFFTTWILWPLESKKFEIGQVDSSFLPKVKGFVDV